MSRHWPVNRYSEHFSSTGWIKIVPPQKVFEPVIIIIIHMHLLDWTQKLSYLDDGQPHWFICFQAWMFVPYVCNVSQCLVKTSIWRYFIIFPTWKSCL